MTEGEQYVLGYREEELERLKRQGSHLAQESSWLFDQLEPLDGARVLEIGCGPHGCLDELSRRVGTRGSVVGVERSAEAVAMANEMVASEGLTNVEVIERDARSTGLPRSSFDLVTSRLVLVNIPHPEQVVSEAVALAKPGCWVAFHEADWVCHLCEPPLAAWNTLVDLFVRYSEQNGIDPYIGRRVPRLLRAAGIDDVEINPIVQVCPPGHNGRSILLDFAENLSERLVSNGLVNDVELRKLKADLAEHLADDDTVVITPLRLQVWGRVSPTRQRGLM
jgi:ubiquinone/menaquinone biosynthesis C-methylase UbiE